MNLHDIDMSNLLPVGILELTGWNAGANRRSVSPCGNLVAVIRR